MQGPCRNCVRSGEPAIGLLQDDGFVPPGDWRPVPLLKFPDAFRALLQLEPKARGTIRLGTGLVDDTVVDALTSVSLGLIVTELVINALKHAFPEGQKGKVTVAYASHNGRWTLTVKDNGVGRATTSWPEKAGLGNGYKSRLSEAATSRGIGIRPPPWNSGITRPREPRHHMASAAGGSRTAKRDKSRPTPPSDVWIPAPWRIKSAVRSPTPARLRR